MTQDGGFWWFRGASVKALVEQLVTGGVDMVRLEVRIDDKDAMTFRVVPEKTDAGASTESHEGDINDSHRCPPFCPE